MLSQTFTTILAAYASLALGKTIKVTVGSGGLVYSPNNLVADIGDEIEFSYFPKNHTVTQSNFANPCVPLEGGFFSGFVPTTESPSTTTFTITVKDAKPIWFYCSQGPHCKSGMFGAINAPTTGNTFEAFAALAAQAGNGTAPATGVTGGVLSDATGSTGSIATPVTTPSAYISSYTTAYATTELYTSTWTSDGAAYTSTIASTFTTTAVVRVTGVQTGAPQATESPGSGSSNMGHNLSSGIFSTAGIVLVALSFFA